MLFFLDSVRNKLCTSLLLKVVENQSSEIHVCIEQSLVLRISPFLGCFGRKRPQSLRTILDRETSKVAKALAISYRIDLSFSIEFQRDPLQTSQCYVPHQL